jgi:hypothetical protein
MSRCVGRLISRAIDYLLLSFVSWPDRLHPPVYEPHDKPGIRLPVSDLSGLLPQLREVTETVAGCG